MTHSYEAMVITRIELPQDLADAIEEKWHKQHPTLSEYFNVPITQIIRDILVNYIKKSE